MSSIDDIGVRGNEAIMLRDAALDEKINQFLRRKKTQYPVLSRTSKHLTGYSGNFRKTVDPQPYIDIIS